MGPGAGEEGGLWPPWHPLTLLLFHCAAGDAGRGMAPTCPQTPSAPSLGWGWVWRGLWWSEHSPLLPPGTLRTWPGTP